MVHFDSMTDQLQPASPAEEQIVDPVGGHDSVRVDDPGYACARDDLKLYSDTRWSPWRTIDGNDDRAAAVAALEAVADAWAKAMPAEPPQPVMVARA